MRQDVSCKLEDVDVSASAHPVGCRNLCFFFFDERDFSLFKWKMTIDHLFGVAWKLLTKKSKLNDQKRKGGRHERSEPSWSSTTIPESGTSRSRLETTRRPRKERLELSVLDSSLCGVGSASSWRQHTTCTPVYSPCRFIRAKATVSASFVLPSFQAEGMAIYF